MFSLRLGGAAARAVERGGEWGAARHARFGGKSLGDVESEWGVFGEKVFAKRGSFFSPQLS